MQVATDAACVRDAVEPRMLTLEAARYCGFKSPRGLLSAFRRGKGVTTDVLRSTPCMKVSASTPCPSPGACSANQASTTR
jgi:AraC-like DNA-binding protein